MSYASIYKSSIILLLIIKLVSAAKLTVVVIVVQVFMSSGFTPEKSTIDAVTLFLGKLIKNLIKIS